MKVILICHKDSILSYQGIASWLNASFDLVGMVVIEEKKNKKVDRIKKELKRSGFWGLIDVFLFRFYYKFFMNSKDKKVEAEILSKVEKSYGAINNSKIASITVTTPNSKESEEFIKSKGADFVIARCKFLLRERIFSLPKFGTYVFHPGICPEYRNAHGCYWAIMNRDYNTVGATMLRIDKGVDTGPIFAYLTYDYDAINESHITIQSRVVFENLEVIAEKMKSIYDGSAVPIEVAADRQSNVWGQPKLTTYYKWKLNKQLK